MGKKTLCIALVLITILAGVSSWRERRRAELTDMLSDRILHVGMELEDRNSTGAQWHAADLQLAREVSKVLASGAETNDATAHLPALHLAIRYELPKTLEVLLKAGADVNRPLPWGEFPFQEARRTGNKRIIQMLRQAGARE